MHNLLAFPVSVSSRIAMIGFLLNLGLESSGVFLPLYARSIGASDFDVGLIAAAHGSAFFLASIVVGRQSDIHGRVPFVRAGLGLLAVSYLLQIITTSPAGLLAARAFIGLCLGAVSAVMMAYTYDMLKQIGNYVSFGALGWATGAAIAALAGEYHVLFAISAGASVLGCLVGMTLHESPVRTEPRRFTLNIKKDERRVYFAFFIRQIGAQAIWAIFPLYLAGIGASKPWIAFIDGFNMAVQFVAMRFVERLDPWRAFRVGLVISVLVFAVYGAATSYLQLIPVQPVLAAGWSLMFIGAFTYLMRRNLERGSVSGQLYSTLHLSAVAGPFAGGAIAHAWGYSAVMFFASALSAAAYIVARNMGYQRR